MTTAISVAATVAVAAASSYTLATIAIAHYFTTASRTRANTSGADATNPSTRSAWQAVRFAARDDSVGIAGSYLPADRASGAVLLVHGKDSSKTLDHGASEDMLVNRIHASGFSVLAIDLRGHGESDAGRLTYGYNERLDVLGAVDWLLGRGYRAGRIGAIGVSMGGAAVIAAAAEEPALGAVVSDSAFADLGAVLQRNFPRVFKLPGSLLFLAGGLWFARWLTGVALDRFVPANYARQLRARPLMIVHSAGDRLVPSEHAEALARAAGTRAWITPTDGHIGSFRADPEVYVERILEFFSTHLARAEENSV